MKILSTGPLTRTGAAALCLALSGAVITKPALAEGGIAPTIFKSMLYGIGMGAVVGGLILVAQSETENIAATLAISGLAGAGVGAGIGMIEIMLDPQYHSASTQLDSPGLQIPKPLVIVRNTAHNRIFTSLSSSHFGWGIQFGYNL